MCVCVFVCGPCGFMRLKQTPSTYIVGDDVLTDGPADLSDAQNIIHILLSFFRCVLIC